jgi:hypothetical protein
MIELWKVMIELWKVVLLFLVSQEVRTLGFTLVLYTVWKNQSTVILKFSTFRKRVSLS